MVIEGNSQGTFFSGVRMDLRMDLRMDVRMDGRMDVSRVVDRDRIHAREQKNSALERKSDHEWKKKDLTIYINYKHLSIEYILMNNLEL